MGAEIAALGLFLPGYWLPGRWRYVVWDLLFPLCATASEAEVRFFQSAQGEKGRGKVGGFRDPELEACLLFLFLWKLSRAVSVSPEETAIPLVSC